MPKPSYKSLEGQSLIGIVCSCIVFLYLVLTGERDLPINPETILESASNAKEIALAYKTESKEIMEALGLGKIGAFLFFIYKIYGRFTDSRTELKKKELEK